jgi:simple sugar transport system permease protein
MAALFTQAFLAALIGGAIAAAVPLLFAGLGEQMSEKAGVLNIGIEGMMLIGAYAGFLVAYETNSLLAGFAAGGVAGLLTAGIMALACVWLGLNQIVIGIAITLTVEGLTALLFNSQFASLYPSLPTPEVLAIPLLSAIPVLGPSLFTQHWLADAGVLLCLLFGWVYRHSFFGLNLAAAGDKPAALDAAGVNVAATRCAAVLVCGLLSGIGGAYLAEVGSGVFVPFMTNGAGFIGIVLAMLARGRPLGVLLGAVLFGACLSMTTALQVAGINVPTDIINMLPFAMVMLALVIFGRRASLPAAFGHFYQRGAR